MSCGKQADERGERREVPLRPDVPAVDVDGVAHGLERIKADAKRQAHACQRQGKAEQAVHRRQEEVGVFEKAEQPEIQQERRPRSASFAVRCAAPPLDAQAERPVRNGREQQREHIHRLAERIEQQACDQQNGIPPTLRRESVDRERERKKGIEKYRAGEYHLSSRAR